MLLKLLFKFYLLINLLNKIEGFIEGQNESPAEVNSDLSISDLLIENNDMKYNPIEEISIMDTGLEYPITGKYNFLKEMTNDIKEEQDIIEKSAILRRLLEDPNLDTLPLVYIQAENDDKIFDTDTKILEKRSRYYRRYPWKRQNSRHRTYEADTRYLCVPSREDVFKLLVGLHESRKGNHQKTVNFCNQKRPAKAIFTNIRFVG